MKNILNMQQHDTQVITAGLPTQYQYKNMANEGVTVVINLMPNSRNSDYTNEAELVVQAGMKYIYIPVDWQNPTEENVEQFFTVMRNNQDEKIMLHCALNYRASAFYYLYLKTQTNVNHDVCMDIIMKPLGDINKRLDNNPKWRNLIEIIVNKYNN